MFEVATTHPARGEGHRTATKLALRRAMELIVPPHVLNRRKLGFPVPIRHYLADGFLRLGAVDHRERADARSTSDRAAVLALLDAHRAGKADYSRQIWTMLVFQLWHGIFVTGRSRPEIPEPVYPVTDLCRIADRTGRRPIDGTAAIRGRCRPRPRRRLRRAGSSRRTRRSESVFLGAGRSPAPGWPSANPAARTARSPARRYRPARNPARKPSPTPVGSTLALSGTAGTVSSCRRRPPSRRPRRRAW